MNQRKQRQIPFSYGQTVVSHAQKEPFQSEEPQKRTFREPVPSKDLEGK